MHLINKCIFKTRFRSLIIIIIIIIIIIVVFLFLITFCVFAASVTLIISVCVVFFLALINDVLKKEENYFRLRY